MRKDVDALELLVRARKIAPKNTDILLLMVRLSMNQLFFEDAIELLNEGVQIDRRRADLHAHWARATSPSAKLKTQSKSSSRLSIWIRRPAPMP